ncbi:MAG TPA: hypothetical protein VMG12_27780 [Polyangiaceae bacterium]|nr:hypothetical protein [Polyangiaceae bacterium]
MMGQGTVPRGAPGTRIGRLASGAGLLLGLLGTGCGGGVPLLHPAQPLPSDTVSFGAGLSGQFVSSGAQRSIDRGRAAATGPLSDPATARSYAEGVLMDALLGPGISPWVSARVGLPHATEAGLTYTGRSLRLDGRHVLALGDEWALSLGLGASAVLLHPDSSAPDGGPTDAPSEGPAEFGLDANGWGGDLPILVGYQPIDGFVDVWMGARTGFEHVSGELRARNDDAASPRFDASGNRLWAGVLAGVSLGIPPIWFRFELAGTFHRLTGELTSPEGQPPLSFGELDATGWSLAPSGAILGKF